MHGGRKSAEGRQQGQGGRDGQTREGSFARLKSVNFIPQTEGSQGETIKNKKSVVISGLKTQIQRLESIYDKHSSVQDKIFKTREMQYVFQ